MTPLSDSSGPRSSALSEPNALAVNQDFEFAALNEAKNYRATLVKTFAPHLHGNVLEVGAGIGQLASELRQVATVKRLVAVEPDAKFHPQLLTRFSESEIVRGTAAQVDTSQPWDAIVSVNVLEHIENDVAELALYRRLLAGTRGRLCLFVPARAEIYAPIDRDFGHFRRYTAPVLRERLIAAGFEITRLNYFNFPGYFLWWFVFRIARRRGFSRLGVKAYDRFFFPPIAWAESHLARPPIGQSLIAVARASS